MVVAVLAYLRFESPGCLALLASTPPPLAPRITRALAGTAPPDRPLVAPSTAGKPQPSRADYTSRLLRANRPPRDDLNKQDDDHTTGADAGG